MKKSNILILCVFAILFLEQLTFSQTVELWGTAFNGGKYGVGTVYKINSNSTSEASSFQKVHDFQDTETNGARPVGQLVQIGCKMYGVTERGGSGEGVTNGVLYSIDLAENGSNSFVIEFEFPGGYTDEPQQSLGDLFWIKGVWDFPSRDILAYGDLIYGVDRFLGQLFSFDPSTKTYTTLYQFTYDEGDGLTIDDQNWPGGIIVDNQGVIYGHTFYGGESNVGTIWKYDIGNSSYEVVADLADADGARNPYGKLLKAANGDIYINCQGHIENPYWGIITRYTSSGFEQIIEFYNGSNNNFGGFCAGSLQEIPSAGGVGKIFGATRWTDIGGGALFSIRNTDSSLEVEYTFDAALANDLASGLFLSDNFNMYAATHGQITPDQDTVPGQIIALNLDAPQLEVLHYFNADGSEGRNSIHGLLNQKDGTKDYSDPQVCPPTGVANISDSFPLSVYPNPTNGMVNLEIGVVYNQLIVNVTNLVGKTVHTSQNNTTFDLSDTPAGVYFVTIEIDDKVAVEKLVIE